MNNLVLLLTLLIGSQEASALTLDSVYRPLAIEKSSESIQIAQRMDDEKLAQVRAKLDELVSHMNASEFNSDGTAERLAPELWPQTSQKQARRFA